MKLEANITRFAPNDGYIMDIEKERKATEETYEFYLISYGNYLCISGDNAYGISEAHQGIGCGCADMTYNCNGKEVCKHLIQFMRLRNPPDREIPDDIMQLMEAAGWSGKQMTPPERPKNRKKNLPSIPDTDRKPSKQADSHKRYASMTPEEIMAVMDMEELKRNARRGAPMAIAELQRRIAAGAVSA